MTKLCAIKGNIVSAPELGQLSWLKDGYIVTEDGVIRGVFPRLPERYAAAEVEDYGECVVTPSFSDLHLHAPQYPMLGTGFDLQLIDWLSAYAFPTEAMFANAQYARAQYKKLAQALIARGTTRVCMFSSLHREATLILMEELEAAGVTGYVGKVNMDRNGAPELSETTAESLAETERWLGECARFSLVSPVLTPRFTPSCTDELMAGLGRIAAERPALAIQSHLSENTDEVAWVGRLHPDCAKYWQSYAKFGLWRPRAVMAHCVYSDEEERRAMREHGVWAIHCPDSNTNIASGIAPVRRMLAEGVKVALGSDIAGGAKLFMLDVATEAVRASRLRWLFANKCDEERYLSFAEAFYLATTAGQEYFGAGPGFAEGDALHAVVLDDSAFADNPRLTPEDRLQRLMYLADSSHIRAVYSAGARRR